MSHFSLSCCCTQGIQVVCISSGMNLNHLPCCTQWGLTIPHGYWKIGEHVCFTAWPFTVYSYFLGWKTWWSLDDSEVNSRHQHESTGSAWEGLHGEYCCSESPLRQRPRNLFWKDLVVNSSLTAPATRFSISHTVLPAALPLYVFFLCVEWSSILQLQNVFSTGKLI